MNNMSNISATHLLFLPAEIRNLIYKYTTNADLDTLFNNKKTKPGLLQTSQQLRNEYSSVFFDNDRLSFDAYDGPTTGWRKIHSLEAQCKIFESASLSSILGIWSLISARENCMRECERWQGVAQTGIITVKMESGIHRWRWSCGFSGS